MEQGDYHSIRAVLKLAELTRDSISNIHDQHALLTEAIEKLTEAAQHPCGCVYCQAEGQP